MLSKAPLSDNIFYVWFSSAISFEAGSSVYLGLRINVASRRVLIRELQNSEDFVHQDTLGLQLQQHRKKEYHSPIIWRGKERA